MSYLNRIIICVTLLFMSLSTTSAQEIYILIGKMNNSSPELSVDTALMFTTYKSNLLQYSGINVNFNQVSIKISPDNKIYLVFKGNDLTDGSVYKSTFLTKNMDDKFYLLSNISCTSSACAEEDFGCTPKMTGVSCWPCNNKGKCTKTVTDFSLVGEPYAAHD